MNVNKVGTKFNSFCWNGVLMEVYHLSANLRYYGHVRFEKPYDL